MDEHIIRGSLDDILFCLGASLRYALGRRTYSTSLVPEVIINNLELYNSKWLINNLRDIDDYIKTRERWNDGESFKTKYDDEGDYSNWLNLKQKLIDEYTKREFNEPLTYYGIRETVLNVYHMQDNKRTHIGTASTILGATNVIVDYLIMRGCKDPFYFKRFEDDGVLKYTMESHKELFEVETKDVSKREGIRE